MAPSTATTVLLVRHGVTGTTGKVLPGRAPGLHLAAKGVTQAQRVAERLAELATAPSALYVSPLERTRETAAPIAAALSLRARSERGLLECDFGDWTGKTLASLRKKPEWRAVQHAPSTFRFPSGESFTEMQVRIWTTLERLAAAHPGETIVVVSHADHDLVGIVEFVGHEAMSSVSDPVLFTLSTIGVEPVRTTALIEQVEITVRWKRSRGTPWA